MWRVVGVISLVGVISQLFGWNNESWSDDPATVDKLRKIPYFFAA